MKKLLHLYNYGHNPFPKLGKGGLGYHLPQYKIRGGKIRLNADGLIDDDGDDENPVVVGEDDTIEGIYSRNPDGNVTVKGFGDNEIFEYSLGKTKTNVKTIEPKDPELKGAFNLYKPDYDEEDEDDENKYTEADKFDPEEYERRIQVLDVNDMIEQIQSNLTEKELSKYIKGWSDLDTPNKRKTTDIIFNKYLLDEEQKKEINRIKKLSPEAKERHFINWIKDQKISINEQTTEIPSVSDKEFDIPDIEFKNVDHEIVESVKSIELESPSNEYDDTISTINNMVQQDNIFMKSFPERVLIPEPYSNFKQAFSLLHSVSDLVVTINGVEYSGTGGLDFEYKIKENKRLFEKIVEQTLGTDAEYIGVKPDKSGYEKSDYVIEAKQGGETVFIDLELKKYMSEKGKKGQDLKAYEKVAGFDSVEKINKNTSLHFNNWFYTYKHEIDKAYTKYDNMLGTKKESIYKNIYTGMLEAITTNNKIDKDKLLFQHVLSGEYFGVPLTVTKFQTPPKELIKETIMKRHNNEELSEKVVKYMHQGSRKNKSPNMLVPLLLVNDGMLTINIKKVFGDHIPFTVLNMIKNIYSKNVKDALGLPSCFLSNVKITGKILRKSLKATPDIIKPMIEQEIILRQEQSRLKKERELKEKEQKRIEREQKKKPKK